MMFAAFGFAAALAAAAQAPAAPADMGSVEGRAVVLTPGQRAVVTIGPNGPALVDAATLTEAGGRPSGDALGFDFRWDPAAKSTTLVITNGYDRFIDVDAEIYNRSGHHERTSMCTVIARGSGHEMWPYPVAKIVITKFKFVTAGGFSCE